MYCIVLSRSGSSFYQVLNRRTINIIFQLPNWYAFMLVVFSFSKNRLLCCIGGGGSGFVFHFITPRLDHDYGVIRDVIYVVVLFNLSVTALFTLR